MVEPTLTPTAASPPRARLVRPLLIVVMIVVLWLAAKKTGLVRDLEPSHVRSLVAAWGPWGTLGFVGLFVLGELAHVPGTIFVAAAILAWGRLAGFAIGFFAAMASVCISFLVVRAVGGRALAEIDRPFVKRVLARLEQRPIRTVAILRGVLWLTPTVNYALAMTNVRFRDYVIGSAIGLLPVIAALALLFDLLFTGPAS